MKKFCIFLLLILGIVGTQKTFAQQVYVGEYEGMLGQNNKTYLYRNLFGDFSLNPGENWQLNSFDHSSWTAGQTPFGNYPDVPNLIDGREPLTYWPAGIESPKYYSHMYVYANFSLSEPASLTALCTVDNGYKLYIDGILMDSQDAGGFAYLWEYQVPNIQLEAGSHDIGIHFFDYGRATGADFALIDPSVPVPEPSVIALSFLGLVWLVRRKLRR